MKLAIISDIHDNLANLEKCLKWCNDNKVEKVICCGDVCNIETIGFLSANFGREIFLVRGNTELYYDEELTDFANINFLGRTGIINIKGSAIGVCHEPFWIDQLVEEDKPVFIFCGHTHKPWIEDRHGVKIINPGTLGAVFQKATFAYWDVEKGDLELKLLENI